MSLEKTSSPGGDAGTYWAVRTLVRSRREIDFRGRAVLITGGSRGLGLVLARELARGAPAGDLRPRPGRAGRARRDLSAGRTVLAVPCDVTDRGRSSAMVQTVRQHFGRIDVLINNAGVISVGPIEMMTLDDYDEAMATHFWGPLHAMLAVLPDMRQRGRGPDRRTSPPSAARSACRTCCPTAPASSRWSAVRGAAGGAGQGRHRRDDGLSRA